MIPSISVIIPSYNGSELLSENLPSVLESLDGMDRSEIVVVDDHSADHTTAYLEKNFPQIRIIRNTENLGFARSVNRGINEARYDLVFLLNNDIKPEKKYVTSSLKYFEKADTFGVMGMIRDARSHEIMEGIKYPVINISGLKYRDIRDPRIERWTDRMYTFYLCGGNAIINRRKLLELNGLSEIYEPFYQEDVDLSVRAWLSGWKLYFNSKAVCYHKHSATIKKYFEPSYIKSIAKRNRLTLSYIYLTGYQLTVFNLVTWIKSIYYRLLYVLNFRSVYPGYRDFLKRQKRLNNLKPTSDKLRDLRSLIANIRDNIKGNLSKP